MFTSHSNSIEHVRHLIAMDEKPEPASPTPATK